MLLDLSEIVVREGMTTGLDIDQPGVEDPDLVFAEPLRGHLTFSNGGGLINIHGKVTTVLIQPCARCLVEVRAPVTLEVSEHLPIEEVLHPDRKPDEETDLDSLVSGVVFLDQGRPILDLDEMLRQLLITEIPLRALCDEACAGLCPECGANRNEEPCECGSRASHTPLAGLAALLSDSNAEGEEPDAASTDEAAAE